MQKQIQLQKTESNVNVKDDLLQASPLGSKRQKRTGKRICVKFGFESSEEDLLEKAASIGIEGKISIRTPDCQSEFEPETCEERDSDTSEERLSPMPDAEEIIPSDLAEYDFSERENESSKGVASRVDDVRTTASSVSEVPVPNKCRTAVPTSSIKECNPIPLNSSEENSSPDAGRTRVEEMPVSKKEKSSKRRSSSRNKRGDEQESKTFMPGFDCSYEKESSSPLDSDLPDSYKLSSVSKKRARISMQRVNEWLSKLDDEMFTEDCMLNLDAEPLLCEEEKEERDVDSLASDKTEIMESPLKDVPRHEPEPSSSKPTVTNIETQIFGKTYKRERKSNPQLNLSVLNDSRSAYHFTMGPDEECKNVSTRTLRRRRKTLDLQPEDFILTLDKTDHVIDQILVQKDVTRTAEIMHEIDRDESQPRVSAAQRATGDGIAEKKVNLSEADCERCPPEVQLNGKEELICTVEVDRKPVCKTFHEQVKESNKSVDPIFTDHNQMNETVIFPLQGKRGKTLTRRTRALELFSEADLLKNPHAKMSEAKSLPSPCNQSDLQIESFPSSEEPNKAANRPKSFRRSRRLQLFNEETSVSVKPGINSTKGGKEDQARICDPFVEREKVDPIATSCLSDTYENCSARTSESKPIENALKHSPDKSCEESKNDFNSVLSEKSIEWSPVVPHNESEEDYTQNSTSLVSSVKNYQTTPKSPNVSVNPICLNSGMSSAGLSNGSPVNHKCCNRNKRAKSQSPHLAIGGLTTKSMEVEDSELETECILRTFKGAKRKSFILQPSPPKDSDAERRVPQTSRIKVCNDKDATNGKVQHETSAQNGQVPANSLEYSELHPDCNNLREKDLINVESEVIGPTMASGGKGPLKCSAADVCSFSCLDVVESSFRNIFKGSSMPSDSHNAGDIIVQGTDSHTINETELSNGHDHTGKSKVLVSNYKPQSVQSPLAFSHFVPTAACIKVTTDETSRLENEPFENCYNRSVFVNKQVNPPSKPGSAQESIVVNDQKQPGAAPCIASYCTPGLSATPDGLLGSSSADGVSSKGNSVLSGKTLEDAKLRGGNIEGNSSGSSIVGYKRLSHRHTALKLFSSESSCEEDLPCFQGLLFGDAFHPSLDSAGPNNSTNESSAKQQGGGLLMSSSSAFEQEQEDALDLAGEGCPSPSQESDCSVNLFSSQSIASETSAKCAEETEQPMSITCSQRSHLPETKEPAVTEVESALSPHQEPRNIIGFDCKNGQGTDHQIAHPVRQALQVFEGVAGGD